MMTKHFSKWVSKQKISDEYLETALSELEAGHFEANLGGYLYKKRVRFEGKVKVEVGGQLYATRKKIVLSLSTDLPKLRKKICPKNNFTSSRNSPGS